ncbi:MAG: hypothetical protein F6K17_17945 [Okeania sp. SIO3C4]|nr:hypothetical protein [Okeania sp. SIO3C4]
MTQSREGSTEQVIAWKLRIKKSDLLQQGYSGAPVIDSKNNCVLAVATNMEGKGESGRAISVEALKYIWPEVPSELLEPPQVSQIYLLYAFFVGLLLGISAQNFARPIVCSLKRNLPLPSSISTCEKPIEPSEKNAFSIRLINDDRLTIKNVFLKTVSGANVPCYYDDIQTNNDSLVYSCDPVSEPIEVSVTVNKVPVTRSTQNSNRPPQGKPKNAKTDQNSSITIDVINNVTDPDGDRLTIMEVQKKTDRGGIVAKNSNNTVIYTPARNYIGTDSFTYKVVDGEVSKPIHVKVTVNPVQSFNLEEYLKDFDSGIQEYYRYVHGLLKNKNWEEADRQTYYLMYDIMKQRDRDNDLNDQYLYPHHIKNFPCQHLYIIDRLWQQTSGDRSFSLSYQKKMYLEIKGEETQENDLLLEEWGQKLGWFDGQKWIGQQEWFLSEEKAPMGHYPMGGMFVGVYLGEREYLDKKKVLAHAESLIKCFEIQP